MTNLPATLSTLNQQIYALTEKLAPIATDQVAEAMASLIKAGLIFPGSIKPEDAPAVYGYALANVSAHGLRRAVSKLVRGEYENINRAFIPTPPELAAMGRAETRTLVEDLARLKARREALSKPVQEKRDPEMVLRIKAMRQSYKRQHAEAKASSEAPENPMTEERAAYLQQIMAIRDAPNLSAEQAALRRKVSSDIAKAFPGEREAAE